MTRPVASARPVFLYDGDCGFCRRGVLQLVARVGDAVDVRPCQTQDLARLHPDLRPTDCTSAVQLVEPDGRLSRGAEACFRAIAYAPGHGFARLLPRIPVFAALCEFLYRQVARRRHTLSRAVAVLDGPDPTPASYLFARRLALALLALVFLMGFLELALDGQALLGERGIVPLERVASWDQHVQPQGLLAMPSVFWFARSEFAQSAVLGLGALGALLVLVSRFVRTGLLLAVVAWLSFLALAMPPAGTAVELGNPFFGHESDALLVEMAVLALFVVAPRRDPSARVSGLAIALLRLLLLRVLLFDALARLAPGGAWSSTETFVRQLWTGPLPTRLGLAMAAMPSAVAGVVHVGMVGCSLLAPFLVFGPRRVRTLGFLAIVLLVGWTALLETRGPWPILVLALGLFALDDQTLGALLRRSPPAASAPRPRSSLVSLIRGTALVVLAALAGLAGVDALRGTLSPLHARLAPWFVSNVYGARFEVPSSHAVLVLEGAIDIQGFTPIETRVAPSDLYRAPGFAGLVLPRLDLALEYAARRLAAGEDPEPWLLSTIAALLEGRGGVRGLFRDGAFTDQRPQMLRLRVRPFRPADAAEQARSGMAWFQGEDLVMPRIYALRDGVLVEGGR
jgi:predicted DCC family thiol-disulfide oxidoreductase YuxK